MAGATKVVVQNKETLTAPWSAAWFWESWRLTHEDALLFNLPWIRVKDFSEAQRLQADHAVTLEATTNFQLGGSAPEPTTWHALPQLEACGTWTTVTFSVTQSSCRLSCRNLTSPTPKLEQSMDVWGAAPERRLGDRTWPTSPQ